MISYEQALQIVLAQSQDFGQEVVPLGDSLGRVLAQTIVADRDFPPYDRSIRDGIAINYDAYRAKGAVLSVEGTAQAGHPRMRLNNTDSCLEVMTGAILPENTDTVVMYEHTLKAGESFTIARPVQKGQYIHYRGSDIKAGEAVLPKGSNIDAAVIGVLASVGKAEVPVRKVPKVAVVSTGNELVEVGEDPLPHQIRQSNAHTLKALLARDKIPATMLHLQDDLQAMETALEKWIGTHEVLLLSGGVSMGKYDFLPKVFERLGVERLFHRVAQRPGKPFWFGRDPKKGCLIFSYPGNPVSTYLGHRLYFVPWLDKGMDREPPQYEVVLGTPYTNASELTLFVGAKIALDSGNLVATPVPSSGSGDLTGLATIDGFVRFPPMGTVEANGLVPFVPIKNPLP